MKEYLKRTVLLTGVVGVACVASMATGCGRGGSGGEPEFDIPPSLVDRMRVSYNRVRNTMTGGAETLDGEEMMALMMLGYGNAPEIAERPRGEMVFTDDGLSEEERRELWPFDMEAFEATLEAELERDEKGLYRKKDAEGGTFPFNPTMRWINAELEQWAVGRLDAAFTRMAPGVHAKMTGEPEEEGEEIPMWAIPGDGGEYFAIERSDGAWEVRLYQYVLWDGKGKPTLLGEFYSFPSRKEAVAMRTALHDSRSLNNMAVLYWRHRVFPMQFDPAEIREMLELAQRDGVSCAKANMAVLEAHIPEADQGR
jgi:hypothetical protein